MNIFNAIMRAADHVEREPEAYNFSAGHVPSCGSPACMLGWIGCMLGMVNSEGNWDVAKRIGLSGTDKFYSRVSELIVDSGLRPFQYTGDPAAAALGMRLYAAKYHRENDADDRAAFATFIERALTPVEYA